MPTIVVERVCASVPLDDEACRLERDEKGALCDDPTACSSSWRSRSPSDTAGSTPDVSVLSGDRGSMLASIVKSTEKTWSARS